MTLSVTPGVVLAWRSQGHFNHAPTREGGLGCSRGGGLELSHSPPASCQPQQGEGGWAAQARGSWGCSIGGCSIDASNQRIHICKGNALYNRPLQVSSPPAPPALPSQQGGGELGCSRVRKRAEAQPPRCAARSIRGRGLGCSHVCNPGCAMRAPPQVDDFLLTETFL